MQCYVLSLNPELQSDSKIKVRQSDFSAQGLPLTCSREPRAEKSNRSYSIDSGFIPLFVPSPILGWRFTLTVPVFPLQLLLHVFSFSSSASPSHVLFACLSPLLLKSPSLPLLYFLRDTHLCHSASSVSPRCTTCVFFSNSQIRLSFNNGKQFFCCLIQLNSLKVSSAAAWQTCLGVFCKSQTSVSHRRRWAFFHKLAPLLKHIRNSFSGCYHCA